MMCAFFCVLMCRHAKGLAGGSLSRRTEALGGLVRARSLQSSRMNCLAVRSYVPCQVTLASMGVQGCVRFVRDD